MLLILDCFPTDLSRLKPKRPSHRPLPTARALQAQMFWACLRMAADKAELPPVENRSSIYDIVRRQAADHPAPWTLLARYWDEILARPELTGDTVDLIVRATYRRWQLSPKVEPHLDELAARIANFVDSRMLALTSSRGNRPADLYRQWWKPLRTLAEIGYRAAGEVYSELALMQSLPLSELEAPDFIDPYTHEIEDEVAWVAARTLDSGVGKAARQVEFERHVGQIGWSEADWEAFCRAQEGFNAEFDAEIEFLDERDPIVPMWQQIQNDARPAGLGEVLVRMSAASTALQAVITGAVAEVARQNVDQLFALASADPRFAKVEPAVLKKACERAYHFRKEARGLYEASERIVELATRLSHAYGPRFEGGRVAADGVLWRMRRSAFEQARKLVRQSSEAQTFLAGLQELAGEQAEPHHLALVFLRFQHGLGFEEEDARKVELADPRYPNSPDLELFIEEFGDEVLESLTDRLFAGGEPDQRTLERFSEDTIRAYIAAQADPFSPDFTRHPVWMRAFFKAAFEAKEIGGTDSEGKFTNRCVESAWNVFRRAVCPEGALAFELALAGGEPMKEAAKVFRSWHARPRLVAVRGDHVRLSNGEALPFFEAARMLALGLIRLDPDKRAILRRELEAVGAPVVLVRQVKR